MTDPLEPIRALQEKIARALSTRGLELGDDFILTVSDLQDVLNFRINVLPGAIVSKKDFDQEAYDKAFKEIVKWL